ncbi:MATE family efflux transporter [Mycoplasma procyoni]|uniref:MATE family efflux transporter n=1 Tax=Mycoplasma procyoni TaxID=568784 RepID=UPI00197B2937|nr:MATE family efflux transporter [Mycoplasma procyoni]MBN3534559.1 MATE family efflux transporter [Mycoplasma procyoni]
MFKRAFLSFLSHFPSTKQRWQLYFKIAVPIVFSGILVSFNGFIDNFMVTNISGGVAALSFANSYTGIITGIIISINIIGTAIFGQYRGSSNKKDKDIEVIRARYIICLAFVLAFFAIIWISPEFFISSVAKKDSKGDQEQYLNILNQATDYIKIVSFSWILTGITFTSVSLLRETGNGSISFYISLAALGANIVLNLTLIPHYGVVGSAWATIASGIATLIMSFIFIWFKARRYFFKVHLLFKVSKEIWNHFFKRIPSFILSSTSFLFVSVRTFLWASAFKIGSLGEGEYKNIWGLGSGDILGITASLTNIFTSAFGVIGANIALFVGAKLGNNEFEEAKKNAKELKGFHAVLAMCLSSMFAIIIIFIPLMSFLAGGLEHGVEQKLKDAGKLSPEQIKTQVEMAKSYYLKEIQLTCISIAVFNPMWIYFATSIRIIDSGGKTNLTAIIQFLISVLQMAWLALIVYLMVPGHIETFRYPMGFFYFIFFISDFVKMIAFEIMYQKIHWTKNITQH